MTGKFILETIKQHKAEIERFGVQRIGLFGSFVKNNADEASDIDILVELDKQDMYKNYCRVKYYLEDLFHKNIDLITINQFEQTYRTKLAQDNHDAIRREIMESVIYV